MPMAAWAAAEWVGWICKKDGRAQRVLKSRRYTNNSNWRRVSARPPARLTRAWSPIFAARLEAPQSARLFFGPVFASGRPRTRGSGRLARRSRAIVRRPWKGGIRIPLHAVLSPARVSGMRSFPNTAASVPLALSFLPECCENWSAPAVCRDDRWHAATVLLIRGGIRHLNLSEQVRCHHHVS
jgi:hypothetical protein